MTTDLVKEFENKISQCVNETTDLEKIEEELLESLERIYKKMSRVPEKNLTVRRISRIIKQEGLENVLNVLKPMSEDFPRDIPSGLDLIKCCFSPDGEISTFITVKDYLKTFSGYHMDINPDYQRFPKYTPTPSINEENRWNSNRKIDYIISRIKKTALTPFIVVDYYMCWLNSTNEKDKSYFQDLLSRGLKYGLLDGGHRDNLLNSLFKDILYNKPLSKKSENIWTEVGRELNIPISKLRELIENSTIDFKLVTKRNPEEIHTIFRHINCGVPLSKIENINTLKGELSEYFHGLKKDNKILNILSHLPKNESTYCFTVLYYSYFFECRPKTLTSFKNPELVDFMDTENIDLEKKKKHLYILDIIDRLYNSYFPLKMKTSSGKFLSLYMLLSIIYDNNQTVNPEFYYRFMKIFNEIISSFVSDTKQIQRSKETSTKKKTTESWKDRFRTNENRIKEKWELFYSMYEDKSKYSFVTKTDTDTSIQYFLIPMK